MLRLLVCPACRGDLDWSDSSTRCQACSQRYEIVDRIPVLLPDGGLRDSPAAREGTSSDQAQKQLQAEFFDREDAELEISRPHTLPTLYGWLIIEKFRRSVRGVGSLARASAITVCAGSGMDAELLASAGASVIAADISLGAARRAAERSRRYGVSFIPVVADAEHLPLADRTVDLAYVHDGLHHLPNPDRGIREMARVARTHVSITEPARAVATALAVKAGLALDVEDAGNRVNRLTIGQIEQTLAENGFTPTHAERYAMYYRHVPGRAMRLLSRHRLRPITVGTFRAANRAVGRIGNKLTVQARRSD